MDTVCTPEAARPGHIERLTQKLVAGEEAAFAEFHARYFDRLYRFLLIVTSGHEPEAQDALQQTFLRVIRYVRIFDSEEKFWCWLKVLARSSARDQARSRQRFSALREKFGFSQAHPNPQVAPAAEDRLHGCLEESLNEMQPEDRRLLEGKYIEGSTMKELATLTGLSERTVESRLLRLRQKLRERLLRKLNLP